VVIKQPSQIPSRKNDLVTRLIGEGHAALTIVSVEVAMADEVKDVPRPTPHLFLQGAPSLLLQPDQLDQSSFSQNLDSFFDKPFYPLHV
jgi:hypothetical protein